MNLSKTKLNLYSRLSNRKQREKLGLFIAEGEKCVADTIAYFEVEAVVMLESAAICDDKYAGYPIYMADESDMRKISQFQTLPDIIAIYHIPEPKSPDLKTMSESLTLLLDAVQDPGNLGTILRIASWFGISQVVLGTGCADPYNPKAVQSSMGAIGMVGVIQDDLARLIDSNPDIAVCGTLLDGTDIYSTILPEAAFIVMGNEGNGLSDELRKRVTHPLLIPSFAQGSHAESLNVAAATAVTVSEFRRQQRTNH